MIDPSMLRAIHAARPRECWWGPGDRYDFLVTGEQSGGSMFAMDCVVGPGGGPPPHRHLAEDELFFLYDGEISFDAGGARRLVARGESIFIPRGLAHSYQNTGSGPALMLTVYTPAGMEGWFREVCIPVADEAATPPPATPEMLSRMAAAGERYHVEWITP